MAKQKPRTRKAHGYSVYPRKDGRWGWAVTIGVNANGNPDRIQGICKTEALAVTSALDILAKHKAGSHMPKGKDQTLADFLDEWLETYIKPHREPKTFTYYKGMIETHIKPTLGRTPIRKLTAPMVQKLLNEKARPFTAEVKGEPVEKRLSGDTLRGIRSTLRSALTRAFKNGLVAENVARRVDSPQVKRKEPEYISAEDAYKLVESTEDHPIDRLIIVALHTGMRIGEVTGLTWQDIDFENETVRVRGQLQRIDGKLALKSLKSQRSSRTLCLTRSALTALRDQKAFQLMQSSDRLREEFNPMGLVFLNIEQRPLDPKFVNSHLKKLMVRAGIKPVSFHKLRHTAATLMLSAGVPLSQVRDQLGHSQIALTANIYGHAVPAALRAAAESLEQAINRKHGPE